MKIVSYLCSLTQNLLFKLKVKTNQTMNPTGPAVLTFLPLMGCLSVQGDFCIS